MKSNRAQRKAQRDEKYYPDDSDLSSASQKRNKKDKAKKNKKEKLKGLLWSRIITVQPDMSYQFESYEVSKDLKQFRREYDTNNKTADLSNTLVFDPKAYNKLHKPLLLHDFKLSQDKLLDHGKRSTQIRDYFTNKSHLIYEEMSKNPNSVMTTNMKEPKRLYRYQISKNYRQGINPETDRDSSEFYPRRRTKLKCCQLSVSQKLDIVYQVIVGLKSHKDVADIYRVKEALVSTLVRKATKNKLCIEEMRQKVEVKQQKRQLIQDAALNIINSKNQIWNSRIVQNELQQDLVKGAPLHLI